jgi:hypothetical protein
MAQNNHSLGASRLLAKVWSKVMVPCLAEPSHNMHAFLVPHILMLYLHSMW